MSQSPTYGRDTASASSESPKEGDFSPLQLHDNLQSLEEQKTRDDQKDPTVNIVPDKYSSSPLNAEICAPLATNDLGKVCAGKHALVQVIKKSHWRQPSCFITLGMNETSSSLASAEFIEVQTLDGRVITLVSAQTQTDWEWVEQIVSFSCQVQKEIEDPELLQADVVGMVTVPDSAEEKQDEKTSKKEYGIPHVGPPTLFAYKPESKQTSALVEKVPEVESKWDTHLVQCDYCQQLCKPFIHTELLENETDLEMLFCCEQAKKLREFLVEEGQKMAQKELDTKIDVNPHPPFMSKEEKKAAKEQAKERLRQLQLKREQNTANQKKFSSRLQIKKMSYTLSSENYIIKDEPRFPQMDIKDTTGMFTLQEETDGRRKQNDVLNKLYPSGKCFLTLYPDRTGNVFYPSGNVAIVISCAEAGDFTYIIMEDKDTETRVKAIFTNKGRATCYHPNGVIWVNLTTIGGLCCSETGALRRRWSWLDVDRHIRTLPFKPLTLALGPHISVRIHTQERMYLTFAHHQNSVRFSVGSKLKLVCPGNHKKLGQDILERYLQMKSLEIYSLLGRMQTCMSYHSANPHNIKPHYSFIAQMQRLRRQMEDEESPKKIKANLLQQTNTEM